MEPAAVRRAPEVKLIGQAVVQRRPLTFTSIPVKPPDQGRTDGPALGLSRHEEAPIEIALDSEPTRRPVRQRRSWTFASIPQTSPATRSPAADPIQTPASSGDHDARSGLRTALAQRRATDGESPALTPRRAGLPAALLAEVEARSGVALENVRVHYNSPEPATLQAHAYAQGDDIHLAPGQEEYLPHEAWHVVQQKQGRVRPTMSLGGIAVNDDPGLEREADARNGSSYRVDKHGKSSGTSLTPAANKAVAQRIVNVVIRGKPEKNSKVVITRIDRPSYVKKSTQKDPKSGKETAIRHIIPDRLFQQDFAALYSGQTVKRLAEIFDIEIDKNFHNNIEVAMWKSYSKSFRRMNLQGDIYEDEENSVDSIEMPSLKKNTSRTTWNRNLWEGSHEENASKDRTATSMLANVRQPTQPRHRTDAYKKEALSKEFDPPPFVNSDTLDAQGEVWAALTNRWLKNDIDAAVFKPSVEFTAADAFLASDNKAVYDKAKKRKKKEEEEEEEEVSTRKKKKRKIEQ